MIIAVGGLGPHDLEVHTEVLTPATGQFALRPTASAAHHGNSWRLRARPLAAMAATFIGGRVAVLRSVQGQPQLKVAENWMAANGIARRTNALRIKRPVWAGRRSQVAGPSAVAWER